MRTTTQKQPQNNKPERTLALNVRVSEKERDEMHAAARLQDLTLSQWLRRVMLSAAKRVRGEK